MCYFCEVEIFGLKRLFISQKELGIKEYDIIAILKLLHGAVCSYRRGFFFLLFMIRWNSMLHVSKNNLKNVWKIVSVLLVIVWMVMVFVMSNFPAETSSKQSGG